MEQDLHGIFSKMEEELSGSGEWHATVCGHAVMCNNHFVLSPKQEGILPVIEKKSPRFSLNWPLRIPLR
ncbi:MAG: hypothetical protein Q7R43_04375 [Candidatus Daviesbacteria bacterium]|nr:hypothetical protein [Candidatus Daviesbacteria bacterium]